MISVYLASRYQDKKTLINYATQCRAAGIEVTATWLDEPEDSPPGTEEMWAQNCLRDIEAASIFVLFLSNTPSLSGGCHVELGYALADMAPIVLVGKKTNIFHYLDKRIEHFDTWPEALEFLKTLN